MPRKKKTAEVTPPAPRGAPTWTTACPDWADRIRGGSSIIPAPIFPDQAEQALRVFKELRIVDAPGSPKFGEACAPWVFDLVASIFGAYDAESGKRLITEWFVCLPKKNSKPINVLAPIPTPKGWTTMGDLKPGDQVFGADGQPCNVVAVSPIYTDHFCYEMAFSNGEQVIAGEGHLWLTTRPGEKAEARTTGEILATLKTAKGEPAHSISRTGENPLTVQITEVREVPSVPVRCIQVDSPDRQFLFGRTMLPTHNSTLSAGIMMTSLVLNWRQSAEFTILAPTVEISNNVFAPARDMCAERSDEELNQLMLVQSHIKTITNRNNNGTLKVLAADSNTVGGKKSVGTLVEELHLFGKKPDAENMLREALGGLASRPEGFVIYLTTQSDDAPAGVFKQKLQYARDVRDGKIIDKRFVPIIFEHPPDMVADKSCLELENMAMVNPNMGYSVDQEFLEREYRKSKEAGPESFIGFMAKHANVEIGLALRSDRWAGADYWEKTGIPLTLDQLIERSDAVDIGIDGGGLDDLLGLTVIGRDSETRQWLSWSKAWAHTSVLERRKSEASRLRDFEKVGELSIVSHIGEDMEELTDIVEKVEKAGVLDKIGIDPAGVGGILDALIQRGISQEKVLGISQGWKLGGAIKTVERKLADGGMVHATQALMNWCTGNAKIEPRANSILITKQASGTGKIDPLMALFNAASLMALNPKSVKAKFQIFALGARAA